MGQRRMLRVRFRARHVHPHGIIGISYGIRPAASIKGRLDEAEFYSELMALPAPHRSLPVAPTRERRRMKARRSVMIIATCAGYTLVANCASGPKTQSITAADTKERTVSLESGTVYHLNTRRVDTSKLVAGKRPTSGSLKDALPSADDGRLAGEISVVAQEYPDCGGIIDCPTCNYIQDCCTCCYNGFVINVKKEPCVSAVQTPAIKCGK